MWNWSVAIERKASLNTGLDIIGITDICVHGTLWCVIVFLIWYHHFIVTIKKSIVSFLHWLSPNILAVSVLNYSEFINNQWVVRIGQLSEQNVDAIRNLKTSKSKGNKKIIYFYFAFLSANCPEFTYFRKAAWLTEWIF